MAHGVEDTSTQACQAIAYYKGHLNRRRRSINAMLPREVLSEVFFIIAHDAFTARIESHPTFAWLRLAHVCRDWRDILLNSPGSFSFIKIPVWEKGRLETCLHYSRQAPLNIRYYDDRCSRRRAKLYAREQWLSLSRSC